MCSLRLDDVLESVNILLYQITRKNFENLKKKLRSVVTNTSKYSFKDRVSGASDTAGCSPYVLVSVA